MTSKNTVGLYLYNEKSLTIQSMMYDLTKQDKKSMVSSFSSLEE